MCKTTYWKGTVKPNENWLFFSPNVRIPKRLTPFEVRFESDSLSGWSADTYLENKHRIWYVDVATHNNTIWSLFHPETTVQIPLILVSSSISNQFYWCDLNPSTTHLLRGNNSEETLTNLWLILMSSCITLWRRQRFIRTKRRGRTPRGLPTWSLKLAGDETRPTGAPKICVLYNAQGSKKWRQEIMSQDWKQSSSSPVLSNNAVSSYPLSGGTHDPFCEATD